ncbi:MAG: UDP-glucose dehydrogenase family protein, partial [Planctomycetota bacterium]
MHIAVVGTGYVGLVAGTCFAEMGNNVLCVDVDEEKIRHLREGRIPIFEPGLAELVAGCTKDGRLGFTTSLKEAVESSRVIFIAVGTPPEENGGADISNVLEVARDIGRLANGPKVIVDKSTVPVGTAARVRAVAREETTHEIHVVSNPEFLKEGAAVDDFMRPDRLVIGAESEEAFQIMEELYAPFVRTGKPILRMDPASAELTKYASNAMLAVRISFMNEVARICDLTGADLSKANLAGAIL